MRTLSTDMEYATKSEVTLSKASQMMIILVIGYMIGLGTSKPVMDWVRASSKMPQHAITATNTLSQHPIVDTSAPNHPPAKAAK